MPPQRQAGKSDVLLTVDPPVHSLRATEGRERRQDSRGVPTRSRGLFWRWALRSSRLSLSRATRRRGSPTTTTWSSEIRRSTARSSRTALLCTGPGSKTASSRRGTSLCPPGRRRTNRNESAFTAQDIPAFIYSQKLYMLHLPSFQYHSFLLFGWR